MKQTNLNPEQTFTRYQMFMVAILAILQFSIVLDFMVLSPLGAQLMQELEITTSQFGWVVNKHHCQWLNIQNQVFCKDTFKER